MRQSPLLALLLGTLVVEAGFLFIQQGGATTLVMDWRISFFILIPLGLAVLVWLRLRWAPAVSVIYATVGLAMDVATIVQALTKESEAVTSVMASGISGLFYVCLILFGGRAFLDVSPAQMPPESRPPSPPSPS